MSAILQSELHTPSERILCAAWKDPDSGMISEGESHINAICNSPRFAGLALLMDQTEQPWECVSILTLIARQLGDGAIGWNAMGAGDGFLTSRGRFVDRREAWKIAQASQQIRNDANIWLPILQSEELSRR